MTTIYELEKQATPGMLVPIHGKGTCFHDGNLDSLQRCSGTDGDEECWETVAEVWPTTPKKQAKADARLLAHCKNNFMKALEALKAVEAQSLIDYRAGEQTSGMCSTVATVIRTIQELETVA